MHLFDCTVYYEDTDMGGIVYYANYLKFIERARSTWVQECGIDQLDMLAKGMVFAVRRVEADYNAPARLGDQLQVRTRVQKITPMRCILAQDMWRKNSHIFAASVTLVALDRRGKACPLPAKLC